MHDNDNIGIAAIGYDNAGPVGYDEAMYGEISGNTVYNISGITNKGEGSPTTPTASTATAAPT